MEKQAAEILELLKDGMKALPEMGSKAWDMYVTGHQITSIIWEVCCVLFLTVYVVSAVFCAKNWKAIEYDYDAEGFAAIWLAVGGFVALIALVFAVCSLPGCFVPEYDIIQGLLNR